MPIFTGARLSGPVKLTKQAKKKNPYKRNHPMNNKDNHAKLLEHAIVRLNFANGIRESWFNKLSMIDKDISGFTRLSDDDKKRVQDRRKGKKSIPVETKLPLVWSQLRDTLAYCMELFAPDSSIFEGQGKPSQQPAVNALVDLINENSQRFGYYPELSKFIWDSFKYNLGIMRVEWENQYGVKFSEKDGGGSPEVSHGVVWKGNKLTAVDLYNFLWDLSVPPTELYKRGEFCAEIEMVTQHRIARMAEFDELYDVDKYINQTTSVKRFYRAHPIIRAELPSHEDTGTNWVSILSAATELNMSPGIELIYLYIWLRPKEFGLDAVGDEDRYTLYRITIANAEYITRTDELVAAHSMLPFVGASPNADNLEFFQQKSFSEILTPMQVFASYLLNIHQKASRKQTYGITIYDPRILDLGDIPNDDVVWRAPMKQTTPKDKGPKDALANFTDSPVDTSKLLRDVEIIKKIMQDILPSNRLQQVADLDRATEFQSQAVVQSGDRTSLLAARMINSQGLIPMRFMMIANIFQMQETVELTSKDGTVNEINPSELRTLGIEYVIGTGLRGLDRLMLVNLIKDVVNRLIQSPAASEQIDILGLVNYWATLAGDNFDLNQFRKQPQQPAAGPGGEQQPTGEGRPQAGLGGDNVVQPFSADQETNL